MAKLVTRLTRVAGCASIAAGLLVSCGPRPTTITLPSLDATLARWEAKPVRSYRIVVDVDRPGDRRRNEITVVDGAIVRSSVGYWNEAIKDWGAPSRLTTRQATPFTVPGLFALLRQELLEGHRSDCRVAFAGDPPVPQRILLGPVMQSEGAVRGTEATINVRDFQPLPPASTRQTGSPMR